MTVSLEPHENMRLRWPVMPPHLREAAHRIGITGWDNGGFGFRGHDETADGYVSREAAMAPPKSAELAPGESATVEAMVDIGDRVRTGAVTFRFTPLMEVDPPAGSPADAGSSWLELSDASIEIPLTVLPPPDGTITEADATIVAVEDPRVERWLNGSHHGWPGMTIPATRNIGGTLSAGDGWDVRRDRQSRGRERRRLHRGDS